jgi:DNA topoisomerase-1
MWKKGLSGTSAGRVQSVALDYISSREKEVRAFKADEYWSITSDLGTFSVELKKIDGKDFVINKSEAALIKKNLTGKDLKVLSVVSKKRSVSAKAPFKTSTLQQEASSLFGWKSSKTMDVAQSLFGMGMITYHRTDSERTDPQKIKSLRKNIEKFYGKNYVKNPAPSYGSSAGAQDAHEAIRPTYESQTQPLNLNEKKLLDLISSRFKASQMSDAVYDSIRVEMSIKESGKKYLFVVNGSSLDFDGFLKVYGNKKGDKLLPKIKKGQSFTMSKVNANQHFTKAPPRYTDASLIKKLEKEGVGRPSTYASIIKTLEDREYIKRSGKSLEATEIGIIVQEFLSGRLPDLVDSKFTSDMESSLDKLAEGNANYENVMKSFSHTLSIALEKAIKNPLPDTLISDHSCPKCKSKMIKKISKHGPFLACTTWPKCDGTLKIDGSGNSDVKLETGKECPKCGNILVKRKSKSGEFWGCKSFPECKHSEPIITDSTIMCEKCDSPMVKRKGKYGFFLGCSSYPSCKNIKNIKK